jgi:hypothetical protein
VHKKKIKNLYTIDSFEISFIFLSFIALLRFVELLVKLADAWKEAQ